SERALAHLPAARATVVGYPVRREFWTADREEARAALGVAPERPLLLVTGASLGAHAINEALIRALPRLLARCDVLHMTGAADEPLARAERAKLPPEDQARYHVRAYIDDMPAAMRAADLCVTRAGASTLGEYEGWSQAPNAEYLQSAGAAVMLRQADLHRLADVVLELLDDPARVGAMRSAR